MREFDVYRGGVLIGRISLDPQITGGWFEPSSEFAAIKPLFDKEVHYSDREAASMEGGQPKEEYQALAEQAHEEIMAPGLRMEEVGEACSFELIGLTIDGRRAYWR